MTAFWVALQFLTRLPTPNIEADEKQVSRSLFYYPAVGIIIGWLLLFSAALFIYLFPFSSFLQAVLILTAWVGVTGALHLDGLADTIDARAGSHRQPERALAILKDPYLGPMGAVALILVLLLKLALLWTLLEQQVSAWWLAPVLGRLFVLPLFASVRYVREQGLGSAFANQVSASKATQWTLFWLLLTSFALSLSQWLWVTALCLLGCYGWRLYLNRWLGGTTGDTAGAMIELLEVAVLLALVISLSVGGC